MICPVGIVTQKSRTVDGNFETKHHLTHDKTYTHLQESQSINNNTDLDKFPTMIYGWCLQRIIHIVIAMRLNHPKTPLLGIKGDFKSAYRRIHYNGTAAQQCKVSFSGHLIMMLRLCFGGAGCPPTWFAISETNGRPGK
jgi:hypothetical protein